MKYIFITGGVTSSLGKGIVSASLGALLKEQGYKVRLKKMDPYLNVDPGTMSPYQHGEVFVTEDGAETDLDLGHYERFTSNDTSKHDSISAGRIYCNVLDKERKGDYLGETIQVIPHVTNEIKSFIKADYKNEDFTICEIGGTVGDIEATPFLEAVRQFINENKKEDVLVIHLTLLPYLETSEEIKTKPTQHSVRELQGLGIKPDILICRSTKIISESEKRKISLFCNVSFEDVIAGYDLDNIYKVPLAYHKEGLCSRVLNHLGCDVINNSLEKWQDIEDKINNFTEEITIGLVGKYVVLKDAYKSISEALYHAGIANYIKVNIKWINSELLEVENCDLAEIFKDVDGVLVAPGFGGRGVEGKIKAIEYVRTKDIPFLGICYGMQMALIEFARNVLKIADATSSEFSESGTHVVGLLSEWERDGIIEKRDISSKKGGTMRLGSYPCEIKANTLVSEIYNNAKVIHERHRHRYEVNSIYKDQYEQAGLIFSGMSPDGLLPEIIEIPSNRWFVGVQFHPELKSRIFEPRPLFISYVNACKKYKKEKISNL